MRDLPDLRTGIYRHWKGRYYEVIGYAHDANAEDLVARDPITKCFDLSKEHGPGLRPLGERYVVMYVGLELDEAHTGPRHAVRDVDDFFRLLCSEHGTDWRTTACPGDYCPGSPVQRFEYVGPCWYGWPRSATPGASLPDELAARVDAATQPAPAGSRCAVIEPHEPHGPARYHCPGVPPRYQMETSP